MSQNSYQFFHEWPVQKIGSICQSIVPGRTKPKSFDGDIPWITIADITNNYIDHSNQGFGVSRIGIQEVGGKIIPTNSVVMSCVGQFGLVGITTREVTINQQLHAFLCPSDLDTYFLMTVLRAQKSFMEQIATKTTISYMNKESCESVPIPLPPLEEQRKIATILSTWDEAIGLVEQLIAALGRRKQALMQLLLTGAVRFAGFEGFERNALEIGDIAYIEMGQSPPGDSYNEASDGIPLLNGPTEFTDRFPVARQWTTKPTKLCKIGDILLCVRGSSTGRINIANDVYCIGRGLAAIRALQQTGSTKYLEYLLQFYSHQLLARTGGSTFPNIDKASLSSIEVIVPIENEQHSIANVLENCDQELELLAQEQAALQVQKRGLMQQLLTGAVRV